MTRGVLLVCCWFASACGRAEERRAAGDPPSRQQPREPAAEAERGSAQPERGDVRREELPIDGASLPVVMTLREAEGYWSATEDWQLFVSRIDPGAKSDQRRPEQRAVLLVDAMVESMKRAGATETRSARAAETKVTAADAGGASVLCTVSAAPSARSLACVYFQPTGHWFLTTEVYRYGTSDEPAFLREANDITRAALRQVPDWATRR